MGKEQTQSQPKIKHPRVNESFANFLICFDKTNNIWVNTLVKKSSHSTPLNFESNFFKKFDLHITFSFFKMVVVFLISLFLTSSSTPQPTLTQVSGAKADLTLFVCSFVFVDCDRFNFPFPPIYLVVLIHDKT